MKRYSIILILLLGFTMFFLLSSCGTKGRAQGDDNLVYVFCDSSDWSYFQEPFEKIFSQFVRTPILESEYNLRWISFKQWESYKNYKNIFFIGRLDSQDPVSVNIKNLLNPEIIAGVQSGNYFYIPKKDVWARDQYVMFFVSVSVPDMVQKILDLGDLAYDDFRNYYFSRLKEQMFSRMEQKSLQKYLEDHFPFTMRVQHDYFIANEDLEQNFVWLRRLDPDRSIIVHWLPYDSSITLNSRWIIDERNRLAAITLSGDVIVEEETKAYATQFKNWKAIKLEGTWRNDSLVVGGPFKNYTFIDSLTNRIYMLDYYVQAIGKRKVLFLDQLTVLVHTFEIMDKPNGMNN